MSRAAELLGDQGPLARTFPAFESRGGQLEMARAVERALGEQRILLCEAGTGTGKTLAYLVPAILSGKKVVISTATRALQEQIATRDLPLIARHLGLAPRAAVMKGLSNYLCLRRYEELRRSPGALGDRRGRSLALVERWRETTETGDVSSLPELREDDPIWSELSASSETRVGASCAHFEECFVTRMKRAAEAAQLVIVNHHLFFADLALRGPHPGHVIPDYDAVIFDEAHQLEDIATDFFGVRVSSARLESMLRDLERAAGPSPALEAARSAIDSFFAELRRSVDGAGAPDSRVIVERDAWAGELLRAWYALDSALEGAIALAETARGRMTRPGAPPVANAKALADALEVSGRRASETREHLRIAIEGAPGRVTWLQTSNRSSALASSPVDVSGLFRDLVFESIPSVILTSATLATGSGPSAFDYLTSRLGLAGGELAPIQELIASPFDFPTKALLYTPRDMPEPSAPEFLGAAAGRVLELVEACDGGTFVLTTSIRSMRRLAELLRAALPDRTVLLQGDAPKGALTDEFRAREDAVLIATQSFWEGVDIPGRALRLVVLEKIPFAVPTDPITRARSVRIEAEGGSAFNSLHVPAAAISLKQGFGRLIRSHSDSGVVALLDSRVHTKSYGRRLLAALPPARRTDDLDAVRRFFSRTSESSAQLHST